MKFQTPVKSQISCLPHTILAGKSQPQLMKTNVSGCNHVPRWSHTPGGHRSRSREAARNSVGTQGAPFLHRYVHLLSLQAGIIISCVKWG